MAVPVEYVGPNEAPFPHGEYFPLAELLYHLEQGYIDQRNRYWVCWRLILTPTVLGQLSVPERCGLELGIMRRWWRPRS